MILEKNLKLTDGIDGTKLKKLEKEIGEVNTIVAICYLINRFNSSFNVGKALTDTQAAILASDIVEKYPYETIEDVALMFKQVRQGIIGDGKDFKLDGQNVMTKWFPEYLDKKYFEVERINKQVKPETENDAVSQFYAKRRAQKKQQEKEAKAKSEIDKMLLNMDRQMLEDLIIDWNKKDDMRQYVTYLKTKRQIVK